MKVLYIHQYFKTPEEGGAIRSWYIANAMVQAGFSVEMVTAHNHDVLVQKKINGINVHYLPVSYENSYGFIQRIWSFLLFAHKAYYYSRKLGKFDLGYFTSTPLTVGLTALKLHRKLALPFVFEIRDLWPETPIQVGVLKIGFFKFLARKLEMNIYKKADGIVALSPGIVEYVEKIVPGKRIILCPNMSDCDFFEHNARPDEEILKKYKIYGEFVIGYFGAIGKINALESLIEIAKYTLDKGLKIRVFIIGKGSRKEILMKMASKKGASNVEFVDHVSKFELKKYLSVTDAAFVSFAPFKILELNSPNKYFDALASGKLIILNVGGWLRRNVEESNCGVYTLPSDPEDFIEKIKPYLENNSILKEAQKKARNLAESRFERKKLVNELIDFIGPQ